MRKRSLQMLWVKPCLIPSGVTRQGYIGEEKDIESSLTAHTSTSLSAGGVRKYDYEIGRFTSVDPLWEKYTGWTGYQYCLNNPISLIDPNGMLIFASGDGVIDGIELINDELRFQILRDEDTGQLSISEGIKGKNNAENTLIEAINNLNVTLNLVFTSDNTMNDINGNLQQVFGGMYGGSKINGDGTVNALQGVNIEHLKKAEPVGGDKPGQNIIHETLEGYLGARDMPGTTYKASYDFAHNKAMGLYPLSGNFNPSAIQNRVDLSVSFYVNGIYLYRLPISTMRIIKANENK